MLHRAAREWTMFTGSWKLRMHYVNKYSRLKSIPKQRLKFSIFVKVPSYSRILTRKPPSFRFFVPRPHLRSTFCLPQYVNSFHTSPTCCYDSTQSHDRLRVHQDVRITVLPSRVQNSYSNLRNSNQNSSTFHDPPERAESVHILISKLNRIVAGRIQTRPDSAVRATSFQLPTLPKEQ